MKTKKLKVANAPKVLNESLVESIESCGTCCKVRNSNVYFWVIVLLAIVVVAGISLFKNKFIVAIVDRRPIFRFQLSQKLVSSSLGKQTLEDMIVETLVEKELKKSKVEVKSEEIDAEIEKLSQSLSGTKLEDFLKLQGMTLKSLKDQLSLRMRVEKFLQKDISITDEKISSYIKENVKTMTATTEAEKKEEARANILQEEMQNKVQTWISDLLAKAKISRFLK